MKHLFTLLIIISITACQAQTNTLKFNEGDTSPKAELSQVSWIAGHWKGEAFGGITEEIWSPPLGNSMMFSFKLVVDGKVVFYELGGITAIDKTLLLQLKHFGADFKGWEEKDKTVDFKLVKIEENRLYFDQYTFEKISDDEINLYVVIEDNGKEEEVKFNYKKSAMTFNIETERLLLRELRSSDLEGMFELDSNANVHRYLGNKPIKTEAEAKKIIDAVKQQYIERGIGRWAVINKNTNAFMGWSGLRLNTEYNMNGFTRYYDVGYRLIERFWGNGYATESGKAAIAYAFNEMKLPTLYATTEIGNEASHNALIKIGLNYIEDFYFEQEQLNLRWYKIENK